MHVHADTYSLLVHSTRCCVSTFPLLFANTSIVMSLISKIPPNFTPYTETRVWVQCEAVGAERSSRCSKDFGMKFATYVRSLAYQQGIKLLCPACCPLRRAYTLGMMGCVQAPPDECKPLTPAEVATLSDTKFTKLSTAQATRLLAHDLRQQSGRRVRQSHLEIPAEVRHDRDTLMAFLRGYVQFSCFTISEPDQGGDLVVTFKALQPNLLQTIQRELGVSGDIVLEECDTSYTTSPGSDGESDDDSDHEQDLACRVVVNKLVLRGSEAFRFLAQLYPDSSCHLVFTRHWETYLEWCTKAVDPSMYPLTPLWVSCVDPNSVRPRSTPGEPGHEVVLIHKVRQISSTIALYDTGLRVSSVHGYRVVVTPTSALATSGFMFVGQTMSDEGTLMVSLYGEKRLALPCAGLLQVELQAVQRSTVHQLRGAQYDSLLHLTSNEAPEMSCGAEPPQEAQSVGVDESAVQPEQIAYVGKRPLEKDPVNSKRQRLREPEEEQNDEDEDEDDSSSDSSDSWSDTNNEVDQRAVRELFVQQQQQRMKQSQILPPVPSRKPMRK